MRSSAVVSSSWDLAGEHSGDPAVEPGFLCGSERRVVRELGAERHIYELNVREPAKCQPEHQGQQHEKAGFVEGERVALQQWCAFHEGLHAGWIS